MMFSACSLGFRSEEDPFSQVDVPIEVLAGTQPAAESPTEAITAPRLLTICLGAEPTSLFVYADRSVAARSVRQAIYDGPIDILDFELSAVILRAIPSPANGGIRFEPVSVQAGDPIVNVAGGLVNLGEGVMFLPSGCADASCAQVYSGLEPVQVDQLVVKFEILPGLLWSDGTPLTADDSLYSYEIARDLYPSVRADVLAFTEVYQVVDDVTLEWRGIPGYRHSDAASYFFSPLPRHAWGTMTGQDLMTAELPNRSPLGWGAYRIDEWTPGDHISLSRNPNYFRSAEGLPAFDRLVFRFFQNQEDALAALLAGECDYLDETLMLETQSDQLETLQNEGRVLIAIETGSAWEHLDFGISPYPVDRNSLFQAREIRQAVALCIDRQHLMDEAIGALSQIPTSYVHPAHPLANPSVRQYPFDPIAAAQLLQAQGWMDHDENPATARVAQGVANVPDGTLFAVELLTTDEIEKLRVAQIIKESLGQCGIQVEVVSMPWETLFAAGQQGPIFGRDFSLAQFAWTNSWQPPCFLYTTSEIPGPYPDYPQGWGGANVSGYSNPNFDSVCDYAISAVPETDGYRDAHYQAQAIFAEDLPAIPLYLRLKWLVMRPDMCGVSVDPSTDSALWNLEKFNYGEGCGG